MTTPRQRKPPKPTLREELWPVVNDMCGLRRGTYCLHESKYEPFGKMKLYGPKAFCLDESCPILPRVEKLIAKYRRKP